VTKDELLAVSGRIGSDWKAVGNGLKLQPYLVDAIEEDVEGPLRDKVEKMLLKWMAARNEKATIARLTKALFIHSEFDAIKAIKP
jgi:hypothetical protein